MANLNHLQRCEAINIMVSDGYWWLLDGWDEKQDWSWIITVNNGSNWPMLINIHRVMASFYSCVSWRGVLTTWPAISIEHTWRWFPYQEGMIDRGKYSQQHLHAESESVVSQRCSWPCGASPSRGSCELCSFLSINREQPIGPEVTGMGNPSHAVSECSKFRSAKRDDQVWTWRSMIRGRFKCTTNVFEKQSWQQ